MKMTEPWIPSWLPVAEAAVVARLRDPPNNLSAPNTVGIVTEGDFLRRAETGTVARSKK